LNSPTIRDFENLFDTTLLTGEKHRYCHFSTIRLVAGSLNAYFDERQPSELIITPASRDDIISAHLANSKKEAAGTECPSGMILTSKIPPSPKILEEIRKQDIPILYVPLCSYDAMKMITSFTAKIRIEDTSKVERAISLVEENLTLDLLTTKG
jgi:BioD-like phosphotransacetylase family protein